MKAIKNIQQVKKCTIPFVGDNFVPYFCKASFL